MWQRRPARFVAFSALVAGALTMTACGGPAGSSAASAPEELEGRGPITYVSSPDSSGSAQKTIEAWNAAHPDEQVDWIELPLDADQQRQQMVQNAQIKSDAYTVLNLDVVWTSEFAANRWIEPLPEDNLPIGDMIEATVEAGSYADLQFAVPYYTDGALLYGRTDLLEAAGVQMPTTWEEMQQACSAVLALPEAEGMSCYAGQFDKNEGLTVNFSEAVASAGGSLYDEEGKPSVDTPEALDGLNFLVNGFETGLIPKEAVTFQEEQGRQAFQDGKLVFLRNWPYIYNPLSAEDGSSQVAGKFAVAPIPGRSGQGVSTLGGRNLAISSYAENKATALDFINFFVSQEQERARLELSSRAPVYSTLFEDQEIVSGLPYLPTLLQSVESAQPRPKSVQYGATTAAIQDAVYAAITGEMTSEEALSELQSQLEQLAD